MASAKDRLKDQDSELFDEINEYIDELKDHAQGDFDFVVKFLKQAYQGVQYEIHQTSISVPIITVSVLLLFIHLLPFIKTSIHQHIHRSVYLLLQVCSIPFYLFVSY